MKIIKRNGSVAVFDISKIIAAVTKANNVVASNQRLTKGAGSRHCNGCERRMPEPQPRHERGGDQDLVEDKPHADQSV